MFVSAHGNVFMREIADHLVEALQGRGRTAELVTDELPDPDADPLEQLVVAPHEFFPLFPATVPDQLRAAAGSICINTEQVGTPFFATSMQYVGQGRAALDISTHSLGAIRAHGIPAFHLPLGYVRSMDHWRGPLAAADQERTIDIGFLAGRTERREAFIGGAAGQLWEWRTDLRFFSWHKPALAAHSTFTAGVAKYRGLANTRILLNVHRSDDPYFEWARIVEAMANGCAVATETSVGIEPLVPGEHMVVAHLEDLAEQAVALAFDEPRRAAMAEAAHALLTTELDQGLLVDRGLAAVGEVLARPAEARRRPAPWRRISRAARPPRVKPVTTEQQRFEQLGRDLKQAYLAQQQTGREIERALAIARHGDPDHVTFHDTPAYATVAPDVTVVIPLFNQGHFLADAVRSIVAASGEGGPITEVLVVDDHSTDGSLSVARDIVDAMPWFPARIVARSANGGLPVARNTGFRLARAGHVFALDADNLVYPNALRALHQRLLDAADDVVAVYGLLERFDERGSLGLTSHLPWDVELLTHGAFIDAMAMFRVDRWADLGGYAEWTNGIGGWEDYDLWLSAAERGWRAELVAQIVGRYREQPGSMRKISDIDMATNFVLLRERHPRLPWPS